MNAKLVAEILQEFGAIKHWTMFPDPDMGDLSCPPIIAFTYAEASPDAANLLRTAVEAFQGKCCWDLATTDRRWVLMPSQVREFEKRHAIGGFGAARELMRIDPDFGKLANAELGLLMVHIQRFMARAAAAATA